MTQNTHLARTAGSAIAAALALASTPLLAQQAETPAIQPQPTEPATTTTTSPTPVITPTLPTERAPTSPVVTLPNTQPETTTPQPATTQPTMRSEPVVQDVPPPEPETSEAAEATTTPASSQPSEAAAPFPRQRTAEPIATTAAPVEDIAADAAASEPATATETPIPAPEFTPETTAQDAPAALDNSAEPADGEGMLTWLVAALGIAGVALLALLLFRRRRNPPVEKIAPYRAQARPEAKVERAPQAPASDGFVTSNIAAPQRAATPAKPAAPVSIETARPAKSEGGLATAGASVPLPRNKPATVEERTALIDQLAGAAPDRANPFRSPKARRRRARMIVQSLDREFKNGSRIDFSQYPANWPHLARREATAVA